jgi:hypothetical protein
MKLPPKISLVSYLGEKCEARKLFRVLNPTSKKALSFFLSLSVSFCRQSLFFLVVVRSRGIHEPRPSIDESFSFSHESSVLSATSKFFCSYCCFCCSIESEKRPPARRFFVFVHFVCFVFCRGRSIWCWTRKEEDAEDEDARDDDDDDDI